MAASSLNALNEGERAKMDTKKFSQESLRAAMEVLSKSNRLLNAHEFNLYNTYKGFHQFMNSESAEIIKLISRILSQQGIKCRLDGLDQEEIFDVLVEANDLIIEKVGVCIDEASGVNKAQEPVLIAAAASKTEISTSWNRKKSLDGGQTIRLLAGHNVLRPQLKFKESVDNTSNIFVPIIKEKPNSLKPLSVILEQTEYGKIFTHPYQCELDHFKPSETQLQIAVVHEVAPLESTEFEFIDKVEQVQSLVDDLNQQSAFAVDLEHHSYRSFQGITCLMQISTRTKDYLVDPLELRSDLQLLNEAFTNPKIVKVFHGADKDVEWLQRDLGIYVVNMFDTGQASRILNFAHYSLAFLLKHYCRIDADKQYQLADWRIRPLPEEMVKYAREDTHYLLHIYDRMKNELIAKGNQGNNLLLSVFQRSKVICEKRYVKPVFHEDGYINLCRKYGKIFNTRQNYSLKHLYKWRDTVARMEDESTGYVLPNHMLMKITEVLPREMQGISACCNPTPTLVHQYLNEIHRIILDARGRSLDAPASHQLQIQVDESRREIDLDDVLICPHDYSHLKESGTLDTGPTLLDLWNKHGDKLENELQHLSINVPIKSTPQLTCFASEDRKVFSEANKVKSSVANYLSPFARYKLVLQGYENFSQNSVDVSAISDTSLDESRVKSVEDYFIKLVHSHKRKSDESSILSESVAGESIVETTNRITNEEVDVGEKDDNEYKPDEELNKTDSKLDQHEVQLAGKNQTSGRNAKRQRKRKNKNKTINHEEANVSSIKKMKVVINEEEFKPYDYSQTDKLFKGGSNKKNNSQPFDPSQSSTSFKTGKAPKTRLKNKGKSLTFASNKSHSTPKRQRIGK
ncbi:Exosome component 10 [Chamberlinius hualienensis]